MKIFIVCSKHFYHKVKEIKEFLESKDHKITLPNSFDEPFKEEEMKTRGKQKHREWKQAMMRKSSEEINSVDALLVLNFEKKGIPNYIGGATFMEVLKGWELEKKIFFYNPLPQCSFTDELDAINPIVIKGDLTKVQ